MKATVVNTVENTTKVIDLPEAVADLSGLKHFLSIEDGKFFEGTTHTDLTTNTQKLPELPESKKERGYVFFVSPAQNKIKNGDYSRKECYAIIKEQGLGEKVKQEFGRNFTQVGTDALNKFIFINADADVDSTESVAAETATQVADEDAGKIVTEKQLLQEIVNKLSEIGGESVDLTSLVDGVNRVFPTPYSVQDLANMRG